MADVANSISTSPQGRSNSYVTSPCSSSSTLVSPNIVEAIDRIFPKSPSQLLPDGISRRTSSGGLAQSQSNVISSLPCTVSMDHFTTDTTTTATAVFTGLTSSSGTKSPLMSSTPTSQMDLPSLPAQTQVNQISCLENGTGDIIHKKLDIQHDFKASRRISRADLEIMKNVSNDLNPKNGKSGRCSLSEKEFCDSHHQEISDSDDMCRPFVQLQKEKRKKKRKHMKSSNQRKDFDSGESPNLSVTPPTMPKISKLTIVRPSMTPGQSNEDDYCLKKSEDSAHGMSSENGHCSDLNGPITNPALNEKGDCSVDTNIPHGVKDSGNRKWKCKQKLPMVNRHKYHVGKDKKQIQSRFLPCFVVLKSISVPDLQGSYNGNSTEMDLSTKERVKLLASLCAQSKFECISKNRSFENILSYKNFIDTSQYSNSEDEFRIPHGRSLRKRRQDICYAEPSEDDLLEDVTVSSRKNKSGQSRKETCLNSDPLDENQSPKEISPKKTINALGSPLLSKPPERKIKKKSTSGPSTQDVVFVSATNLCKENKQSSVQPEPNQKTVTISVSVTEGISKINDVAVNTSKAISSPNLVYVYPKKNVVKTNTRSSVLTPDHVEKSMNAVKDKLVKKINHAQSIQPGLASSNNRPSDFVSITAAVTQNMAMTSKNTSAVSFALGFSGTPLAASSSAQNLSNLTTNTNLSSLTVRNNTLPSNLCMVKIDGKDYLLSMPASNNIHSPANTQLTYTSTATIPFPQPSLMSAPAPGQRFMFYQSSGVVPALRPAGLAQATVTTKGGNPTFAIPQLSTAVTLPGRLGSNAIHLLPSSLPPPPLLSTPILASTRMSTSSITSVATSSSQSRQSYSTSFSAQPSSTALTTISVPKLPSSNLLTVTSGVISSSIQTSLSTAVTTSVPLRQVRSLVSPLIASGSNTAIRHHPGQSSTTSSSVQLVAPNASVSGARCFRIIVPGCSAAVSTARIATLGTSSLSSPLTRLSASSTLLPQRKHSADKEMSPEKRAAKRRRLEKKYPLPPGVVIKTEPLDNPQTSLTVQAGSVRSLLSTQNIQLITAASRTGVSGVQRFRIISPSTPGVVVGSRPVRLGSNVIIRAPVISSPSSRPPSSTSSSLQMTTSASLTSASSLSSLTVNTTSASSTSLDTSLTCTTISSTSTSVSTSSRGTISLLSPGTLLLSSNTTSTYSVPTSSVLISSVSSTSIVTSSTSTRTALTSAQVSTLSSTQPIRVSSPLEPESVHNASSTGCSFSSTPASTEGEEDQFTTSNVPHTSQADCQPANSSEETVVDIISMRQNVEKLQKLISEQEALGLKGARLEKLKDLLSEKKNALSKLQPEGGQCVSQSNAGQAAVIEIGATPEAPVVID